MEQRGRKGAAQLTVVTAENIVQIGRPEPPEDLTPEQAAVWSEVVNRLPADWFPAETWPLLAQYCRHVMAARAIASMIERLQSSDAFNIEDFDALLRMQEREGRALSSLATRMRITQQSTYSARKSSGSTKNRKPWEVARPRK